MHADLGKNYFELFGLPLAFEIDAADLASRYRELQRRFHPDRFASAPESERRLSVQMTAQINAAYQTLRDVVARARYLLHLQGIETNEETDTRMDPSFLMEQMEFREALDDARAGGNPAAALESLRVHVHERFHRTTDLLRGLFTAATPEAREHARNAVRELQFLQKLDSEIEESI